jgi:hypothetical protein
MLYIVAKVKQTAAVSFSTAREFACFPPRRARSYFHTDDPSSY